MSEVETQVTPLPKPARKPRAAKQVDANAGATPLSEQKGWTTIILEDNDAVPKTGLPIGYNGRFYILKTGEPARVPPGVIEILNHAIMGVPVQDPNTDQVIGMRDRMRYPYRLAS